MNKSMDLISTQQQAPFVLLQEHPSKGMVRIGVGSAKLQPGETCKAMLRLVSHILIVAILKQQIYTKRIVSS
jgi:hypothetical protein